MEKLSDLKPPVAFRRMGVAYPIEIARPCEDAPTGRCFRHRAGPRFAAPFAGWRPGHMRRALDHFLPPVPSGFGTSITSPAAPAASYAVVPSSRDMPRSPGNAHRVELSKSGWREGTQPGGHHFRRNAAAASGVLGQCYRSGLHSMGVAFDVVDGVLDKYANHEPATYPLYVAGAKEGDDTTMRFDPHEFMECEMPPLRRPWFLAIIASNTLAITMVKKANGRVDGFIIEGPTAGGHNAPPRGKLQVNDIGEPIYGERDVVDLPKMCELGLPFWLAGGFGSAEQCAPRCRRAAGVQVGMAFAFSAESGLRPIISRRCCRRWPTERCQCSRTAGFADRLPSGVQLARFLDNELTASAAICDLATRGRRLPYAGRPSISAAPRSRYRSSSPRAAPSRKPWAASACATR